MLSWFQLSIGWPPVSLIACFARSLFDIESCEAYEGRGPRTRRGLNAGHDLLAKLSDHRELRGCVVKPVTPWWAEQRVKRALHAYRRQPVAYALLDAELQPIYVGKATGTRNEPSSTRIGRHMTRSDAAGKGLVHPLEVVFVRIWLLADGHLGFRTLTDLEVGAYKWAVNESRYNVWLDRQRPGYLMNQQLPGKTAQRDRLGPLDPAASRVFPLYSSEQIAHMRTAPQRFRTEGAAMQWLLNGILWLRAHDVEALDRREHDALRRVFNARGARFRYALDQWSA